MSDTQRPETPIPETPRRVLIVDDQFLIVEYLRIWVETYGCEVCGVAETADEAIAQAVALKPDYILMDVRLGDDGDGVEAARAISPQHPCRIVFITGSSEPAMMARLRRHHAFDILIKPINHADLGRALLAP